MRFRHRYLIARAAVFATLLVTAAGTAVSVANTAEQARSQAANTELAQLAMQEGLQQQADRNF